MFPRYVFALQGWQMKRLRDRIILNSPVSFCMKLFHFTMKNEYFSNKSLHDTIYVQKHDGQSGFEKSCK